MKEQLKNDVVRLLLPLGVSSVLLVVLLCGLAQAIESEAQVSFATPSQETHRPSLLDYQTGVSVCQQTQNLVPNPGFEQGGGGPWKLDGWYEGGPCLFSHNDPGPNPRFRSMIPRPVSRDSGGAAYLHMGCSTAGYLNACFCRSV